MRPGIIPLGLMLLALDGAHADSPPLLDRLGLSGSARGSYWSNERRFRPEAHEIAAALWLKARPTPVPSVPWVLEGYLRTEKLLEGSAVKADLREAYVDVTLGDLDLRIGRQITVWGRADFINPTDNLSPRNSTLLVPDESDQRTGNAGIHAAYNLDTFRLIGVWLPEYRASTLPYPPLPGGAMPTELAPRAPWNQWAMKVEQTGGTIEWSASYFDGYDRNPDLALEGPASAPRVSIIHPRIRVVGADAAMNLDKIGLRGEAAYFLTADGAGTDPLVKNPFFYGVLGADRNLGEYTNLNLQAIYRHISGCGGGESDGSPIAPLALDAALLNNQRDCDPFGLSSRVSRKWLNETLETELLGLLWLTRGDLLARAKATWALSDSFKAVAAVDLYRGPSDSFLGRLRDLSVAYLELGYGF